MIIFEIISGILLFILLFWAIYNGSILFVGVRTKFQHIANSESPENEQYPQISLIIPTKNEEAVIQRCLTSILNIDYPQDKMEIIVVDGNSADKTADICRENSAKHKNIKFLSENNSKGKPAALNLALSHASGEIVGVFDADSVPDRQVLKKVSFYFKDAKIKALQGRTTALNEKVNILTKVISIEEKAWFQTIVSGREKLQLFVPLTGSCQFVKTSVLRELGGWDENSLTEDVELALRLVEKNHTIKYASDVFSGQETPNDLNNLFKQRVRWYRGYMETALKYGRLLDNLNRRTIDAEISLFGPFMMVISLVSYVNWLLLTLTISDKGPILNFTGIVLLLTAVSLVTIGIALTAVEKPLKLRNILWVPSIYIYWLIQMCIAVWAFFKLLFRRKRVWTKTEKKGFTTVSLNA
jgi:cellulose synthase/poly-beta-1,6-N-acetylglucosamine synthase-like glycosyltransferase